jgi:hypothetical protein
MMQIVVIAGSEDVRAGAIADPLQQSSATGSG